MKTNQERRKFRRRPLWIVSQLYYPEDTSTGYYLTKIAEGLASRRAVRVVCGQPSYSAEKVRSSSRENHNGVAIERCWATTWNKNVLPLRVINFLTIGVSIFFRLLFVLRRGDQVLVVTNPPLLPFLANAACLVRGAQCFLLIHDVYPEVLVAAGLLSPQSPGTKLLDRCRRRLYRSVEGIAVLGRDMLELVQDKLPAGERDKARIITNWADVDSVRPLPREENALLKSLALHDRFVVLYAGNMGPLTNLDAVLDCAEELRQDAGIHFLMIGSGARKARLERNASRRGLANVTVLPQRPRNDQIQFLNAGDVLLVTLIPGLEGVLMPSRLYNALGAGKPIIALAGERSELAQVVIEENAGWVVRPDDVRGFARAILDARERSALRHTMGANARNAAVKKYRLENIIRAYELMFDESSDRRNSAAERRTAA